MEDWVIRRTIGLINGHILTGRLTREEEHRWWFKEVHFISIPGIGLRSQDELSVKTEHIVWSVELSEMRPSQSLGG
jgi:hypothetical protein